MNEDWEKDLKEGWWLLGTSLDGDEYSLDIEKLKLFISNLLSTQRDAIKDRILDVTQSSIEDGSFFKDLLADLRGGNV